MKKICTLLVLLTICTFSFGKSVPASVAKTVGYHHLIEHGVSFLNGSGDLNLVYTSGTSPTCFYVFNGNHCFVIVSAEDGANPVLGYANDQVFNAGDIPSHVSYLLEGYNKQINYIAVNQVAATPEVAEKWANLSNPAIPHFAKRTTVVSPLLATTWNQNPGYNDLCPYDGSCTNSGSHAYTGCVATATAQIMKYWSWPQHGSGSASYTSALYGTQSADFSSTTYDWASMSPTSYTPAVETLMYQIGVAVHMNYGCSGSSSSVIGSSGPSAEYALQNYFCYSSSVHSIMRSDYGIDAIWVSTIKSEIDQSRPVIYAGEGSEGAHAWVVDGYDASDYFHCNWGWGGIDNGYYYMNNMIPAPTANGDYNTNQYALIGIKPNAPDVWLHGSPNVCPGYQIGFAAGSSGGTWTSSNHMIASVNAVGLVTGVAPGNAIISYSISNTCGLRVATQTVTVVNPSVPTISTPSTSAPVSSTYAGVAIDVSGNIYVADKLNSIVKKINPYTGISTTVAGNGTAAEGGDDMQATASAMMPVSVAVDGSGNLFILDFARVRKVNTSGIITTVAGGYSAAYGGDGGPATDAMLQRPTDLAVDAAGNLYIADVGNYRIRKVSTSGIITTYAGTGISGCAGDGGPATLAQLGPQSVAVDAAGNVYVADGCNVIRKINTAGIISTVAGNGYITVSGDGGPATAAGIGGAKYVAIDGSGNLYISEAATVRMVNTAGIISTVAGNGLITFTPPGDGSPATAVSIQPQDIALDAANNIYFADNLHNSVRKVSIYSASSCNAMSVSELPAEVNSFKVYPNPNNGSFSIEIPETGFDATITVMDLTGRVVRNQSLKNSNEQKVSIDLGKTAPGMYLVYVATNDHIYREKVIVR